MAVFHFKSLKYFWIINLIALILSLEIHAQEGVSQRFFTSQNGLNISWVNSITKSPNNAITIVHSPTFDLAKYDGYNFNYTIGPSGILGKTYEDFSGNLWSIDEGNLDSVFFRSNDKWQNLEFDAGIPFMPTPGMGNKLLFIRDGNLNEFDKIKEQTRIIKGAEESKIGPFIDMTTFQDGSVWITGENGVARYQNQCDTCEFQEQWIDFKVPKAYGLHHFSKPFEGENGELTFISKSTTLKHTVLAGFDGKTWQKLYTSQTDDIHYGWRGHDNSLWIIKGIQSPPPLNRIIKNWNLYHIQKGIETTVTKNRILNRVLNDVVVEPNGAFWLATGSGLAHFSPTIWRKKSAKANFKGRLKKIHEDAKGRLWFAAEDHFMHWNGKWEAHQCNPLVFTGDICSLKNGFLIVGISETGGLAIFKPLDKNNTVTFPFGNEKVRYYDQDKNGNCFIILQKANGTSRLVRYDGEHTEILATDLKIDGLTPGACEVTDIIQARNKDLWIVTFTDVMVFKNGKKKSFDLNREFEWSFSTSILELENGNIWISGSKGIIQYNGEEWSLVQSPEFETARAMTISQDKSIWVASGTGIHRLINGSWVSNSIEEGLPNTTIFDVFEDKQGKIWAATLNGAYCYYPEADTNAPETLIPRDMNSHEAPPTGELQVTFEGHDKWENTQDDDLQYSYRFDETAWSPFENITSVKGVNLSAGSHVFEVRAMDRNGNIDQSPARWTFTVLLPWYLETYFIILMVIAIGIVTISIRFAITRHRQVEKLVVIRTAELAKAKEKAEESEEKYKLLHENAGLGIGYYTPEGVVISFNSIAAKAMNGVPENFAGKSIFDLFPKDSASFYFDRIQKSLITDEIAVYEDLVPLPKQDKWFLSTYTKIVDSKKKILGIQIISQDITEIKEFEIELKAAKEKAEEKESLINMQYNELQSSEEEIRAANEALIETSDALKVSNHELLISKERAEESDRLKTAFLTNMSHEIRTPLNAVLGFSQLITRAELNKEEKAKFSEYIRLNGQGLAKIIDDIIDISKLESKQLSISKSNFDLNILFNELHNYYSSVLVQKSKTHIKLLLELPESSNDEFYINSDEQRLKQILNNLISNAIKYTGKGQIIFGYKIVKNNIEFFVKDTGFGISQKNIAQIFERFTQFSPQYLSKQEGTGLGLSICKNLVTLLGGELMVESKLNKGSLFYFQIPLVKTEQLATIKDNATITLNKDLNKYKILIADDEESNYVLTKRILKPTKVKTDWAQNGKLAVEMAAGNNYDLILMDIKMPEMDGIEATRLIKKQNKEIPIIIQTAFAMKEVKDEAIEAGCDGFIVKPIALDAFLELVHEHIK